MKAKRIFAMALSILMILSVCQIASYAATDFPASEVLYESDGTTRRAVIHDWRTDATDSGLTAVSNYYFSDPTNPRPKFATWSTSAVAMVDGNFNIPATKTVMLEIDHLSQKQPSLSVGGEFRIMKVRIKASKALAGQVFSLYMNRGGSAFELLDGTTMPPKKPDGDNNNLRAILKTTVDLTGEWQDVIFNLNDDWKEISDAGVDYTGNLKVPFNKVVGGQYRLDLPNLSNGSYDLEYIGFFKTLDEAEAFDNATRTFAGDPTPADAPTGLTGVAPTEATVANGQITGVDETMEWATTKTATEWTAVTGTAITGLNPGTYYVRVKATETALASEIVEVTVPQAAGVVIEAPYINNTLKKLARGDDVKIGYYGGSVTVGAGASNGNETSWRALVGKWFVEKYPEATIQNHHAAIGGTGSHFGSFRTNGGVNNANYGVNGLQLDVKPCDLVFIEFAINDRYENRTAAQVKADTRVVYNKIWEANPNADIIVILITDKGALGDDYVQLVAHRELADEYGIPTIDVGKYLIEKMGGRTAAAANWEEYVADSVHPADKGYAIYAELIINNLTSWVANVDMAAADNVRELDADVDTDREFYSNSKIPGFAQHAVAEGFSGNSSISALHENAAVTFKFKGTNAYLWTSRNGGNGIYEVYIDGVKQANYIDMWRNSEGGQQHALPVSCGANGTGVVPNPVDLAYGAHTVTLVAKKHPNPACLNSDGEPGMTNSFSGIAVYGANEAATPIQFVPTDRAALGIPEIEYVYDDIVVPGTFFKKTLNTWPDGVNKGALTFTGTEAIEGKSAQGFVPVVTDRTEGSKEPDKDDTCVADGYSFNYKVSPYNYKYVEIEYYYVLPEGVAEPHGKLPSFRSSAAPSFDGVSAVSPTGKLETNKWAKCYIDFSTLTGHVWNDPAQYPKAKELTHVNLFPFGSGVKGANFLVDGAYTGEKIYISNVIFMTDAPKTPAATPTGVDAVASTGADGKITGVNNTMEYSADNGKTWIAITGEEVTGLAPGTYLVRVAESDEFDPSETVAVVVQSSTDGQIVNYIEARYPDATAIYYVSQAKGDGANSGLAPSTPKKLHAQLKSVIEASGSGDYVIVLLDNYAFGASKGTATIDLPNTNGGSLTITTVPSLYKVGIESTVSVSGNYDTKLIFDETPILLGNPNAYVKNAQTAHINYNAEINFNVQGRKVEIKEGFEIVEMALSAPLERVKNDDGSFSNVPATPVRRTSGIGMHFAYESSGTAELRGMPIVIGGGEWSYARATGYGQKDITGPINATISGGKVNSFSVGGHGPNSNNIGNLHGYITGGEIANAFLGGNSEGKITGNAYMEISGGTVTKLIFGGNNATKGTVSGDAIATITGGTISQIVDKGNVQGNTVLFVDTDMAFTAEPALDYVIYAPDKATGTVELVLDDEGKYAGIKAIPTNPEHFVYVNGTKVEKTDDNVYTLANGTSRIEFKEFIEDISFRNEETDSHGKYGIIVLELDQPATGTVVDLANGFVEGITPVLVREIKLVDKATSAEVQPEAYEVINIKIPKKRLPAIGGRLAYLHFDDTNTLVGQGVATEDSDYYYVGLTHFSSFVFYDLHGLVGAGYIFDAKYDVDAQALAFDVKFTGADANLGALGFETTGFEITDFAFKNVIKLGYGLTHIETPAKYVTAWSAEAIGGHLDATTEAKTVATFKLPMTPAQYKTFDTSVVSLAYPDAVATSIYDGTNLLYVEHGTTTAIVAKPVLDMVVALDNTVGVTINHDTAKTTISDNAATGTMFTAYTFKAENLAGSTPTVTYKIGTTGTPVAITPDASGVYTVPADAVLGDITIDFTYGIAINSIAITGIDVPAPKATPDTTAEAEVGANYVIDSVEWTPAVTSFDYNTAYTVKVTVTANTGYDVSSATTATINGNDATVTSIGGGKLEIEYTYTTADRAIAPNVEVVIPTPSANAIVGNAGIKIPDGETETPYTVVSTVWTDEHDAVVTGNFGFEKVYSATVTIAVEDAYKITDALEITVGADTIVKDTGTGTGWTLNADGTVTFKVTFPATGSNEAVISAKFKLLRASDKAPVTFAEIKFYDSTDALIKTAVLETADTRTDADGYVSTTINVDFAEGTYKAVISKTGYLDYTITDIVIEKMEADGTMTLASFTADLVPGEIADGTGVKNGVIDLDDFLRVMNAYTNPTTFDLEMAKQADIDEDGIITVYDIGYIISDASFGTSATECTAQATLSTTK